MSNIKNQQLAFDKLSKLKVGALFLDTGTGKTKVALDLIASKAHKVDYILWICPFSIKGEIEAERLKWHKELMIDIVGCESIGSSDREFLRVYRAVENHTSFIVVDESLKIKNKEAKRTERILKLGELSEYRLILNGTPLSKNVLDLWTQMQFLSPKILNCDYKTFKDMYCEYYIRGRLRGFVKKQHNIEHLVALIEPYIFDSELELGKHKNYYDYNYRIDDIEDYNNLKERVLQMPNFDFMSVSQMLQEHYCKSRDKAKIIDTLIREINDKVIVFVKFLASIPDGAIAITGEKTPKERDQIINDFRNGKFNVLYITYGCGAFGLNLQFCRNMIFADHTFDYAQRIQAEARIYRMGQESDVNYYNLWCEIGLEKLIKASLEKKENLLSNVKDLITKSGNLMIDL